MIGSTRSRVQWDPSVCPEKIGVSINNGVVELDVIEAEPTDRREG